MKNFIFRMEVRRCCCAWRRDIFHNCISAIHLCSVNPNTQLFSGDCLKPFDAVMVTDNSALCSGALSDPNSVPNLWGSFMDFLSLRSELLVLPSLLLRATGRSCRSVRRRLLLHYCVLLRWRW